MKEGTVVIVAGKFDERIRKNESKNVIGTVVKVGAGEVWVLLPDGNFWVGPDYLVYPLEEGKTECKTD